MGFSVLEHVTQLVVIRVYPFKTYKRFLIVLVPSVQMAHLMAQLRMARTQSSKPCGMSWVFPALNPSWRTPCRSWSLARVPSKIL